MQLQDNDFALFGLAQRMEQDAAAIDARWKALQRQAHPDRFAAQGAAAQRLAMQWSARINQARTRLTDPVQRAAYLCALAGYEAGENSGADAAMPADFLMQQMQWREALDAAREQPRALQNLLHDLQEAMHGELRLCTRCIDALQDWPGALQSVRRLMFLRKLVQDVRCAQCLQS